MKVIGRNGLRLSFEAIVTVQHKCPLQQSKGAKFRRDFDSEEKAVLDCRRQRTGHGRSMLPFLRNRKTRRAFEAIPIGCAGGQTADISRLTIFKNRQVAG